MRITVIDGPTPPAGFSAAVRFGVEYLIAAVLAILAIPLIAISAVLVKLTSRGPVFYSQVRVGKHGKPFVFYKIRTMTHCCEDGVGATWSTPNDPRITPIGKILRPTHLDELPQLWHVLRGEMNLVGPRPERPEFIAELEKALPEYMRRHVCRPGITGMAQVYLLPDVSLECVRRKLIYDLYYIEYQSLSLDLRLMICTVLSSLTVPFDKLTRKLFGLPTRQTVLAKRTTLGAETHPAPTTAVPPTGRPTHALALAAAIDAEILALGPVTVESLGLASVLEPVERERKSMANAVQ